jgi:hypothetical protein
VGHGGAMPGFVAGVFVDAEAALGSVWAANTTYGGDRDLSASLLSIVREAEPRVVPEWEPAPLPPEMPLELLGIWYWGPNPYALRAGRDGLLELGPASGPGRRSRFRLTGGEWLGLDGYFAGERLRIGDGSLDLATFIFTREPYGDDEPGGWVIPPAPRPSSP